MMLLARLSIASVTRVYEHYESVCMSVQVAMTSPNMMSLGFAYDVSHIIMTSLAFAFHS